MNTNNYLSSITSDYQTATYNITDTTTALLTEESAFLIFLLMAQYTIHNTLTFTIHDTLSFSLLQSVLNVGLTQPWELGT